MPLKKYEEAQREKVPAPPEPTPSGVGCTELKCPGEMMHVEPRVNHPELKGLQRAICGECGWRGWV